MKKINKTWTYQHEDLFPDEDTLVVDDHILNTYINSRTGKHNEQAIIEVWECFKGYLKQKLLEKDIKRIRVARFCTLQKKFPEKVLKTKFLNDPIETMCFLDYFLGNMQNVSRYEKYYENNYGGLTHQEIEEKINESIIQDTLFKIKRGKQKRRKNNQ